MPFRFENEPWVAFHCNAFQASGESTDLLPWFYLSNGRINRISRCFTNLLGDHILQVETLSEEEPRILIQAAFMSMDHIRIWAWDLFWTKNFPNVTHSIVRDFLNNLKPSQLWDITSPRKNLRYHQAPQPLEQELPLRFGEFGGDDGGCTAEKWSKL